MRCNLKYVVLTLIHTYSALFVLTDFEVQGVKFPQDFWLIQILFWWRCFWHIAIYLTVTCLICGKRHLIYIKVNLFSIYFFSWLWSCLSHSFVCFGIFLKHSQLVGCSRGSGCPPGRPVHCSKNCTTTPDGWWRFHGGGSDWLQSLGKSLPGIWVDLDHNGRWQQGLEGWDRQVGRGRQAHRESSPGTLGGWMKKHHRGQQHCSF